MWGKNEPLTADMIEPKDSASQRTRFGSLGVRVARAAARLRSDLTFAAIDALTVVVSYIAAMGLRSLDGPVAMANFRAGFLILLPIIVIIHLGANLASGVYGHEWEYASVEEAMRLLVAGFGAGFAILVSVLTIQGITASPTARPRRCRRGPAGPPRGFRRRFPLPPWSYLSTSSPKLWGRFP